MPRRKKTSELAENENGVVVLEGEKLRKVLEKFVVKDEGHWWFKNWTHMGRKPVRTEYVKFNANYYAGGGRSPIAHRWVWMQLVGPIDDGMVLDHLCAFRGCVNPRHIEAVSMPENSRRGHHTECVQRGEGTLYSLADGTTICIHDDRSVDGYGLVSTPTDEAVARAAERPPLVEKPQPRTEEFISRKLWDPVLKVHGEAVWDYLPERAPGRCQWEGLWALSDPIREVKSFCLEQAVGDGPSCATHKQSAFFRK